MEVVQFGGWSCARVVSGEVEALITLDVGPRVIRLGFIDGPNEMYVNEGQLGETGGPDYKGYGGHRLWIAPESPETYFAENDPVLATQEGTWLSFRSKQDDRGLERELRIRSGESGTFELEHRIHHLGGLPVTLAPWTLTVMAAGGECLFPQDPFVAHSENYLPVRPLVLWSYTDMQDPRWTWGTELIRLRHDSNLGPQKVGAFVRQGWAAYRQGDRTFMKHFPARENAPYPDYGCNFETFTRHDMLEVEALGPLENLHEGDHAALRESWCLTRGELPDEETELRAALESIARGCPTTV